MTGIMFFMSMHVPVERMFSLSMKLARFSGISTSLPHDADPVYDSKYVMTSDGWNIFFFKLCFTQDSD